MASEKILVIDDEITIVEILQEFLTMQGYSVTGTTNSQDGLKLLYNESYDLVITDLKMPELSGMELLEAANYRDTPVPFIVLTGYASEDIREEAQNLGAYECLRKPLELKDLLETVESALVHKGTNL